MSKDFEVQTIETLQSLGFSEKESLVYVALIRLGQGTVTQIADAAGLKKPIIYVLLESLLTKGFVTVVPHAKKRTYRPTSRETVMNHFQGATLTLASMLKYFEETQVDEHLPRVTAYYSEEGMMKVWDESLHHADVCIVSSFSKIKRVFGESWTHMAHSMVEGKYRDARTWRMINTDGAGSAITDEEKMILDLGVEVRTFEGAQNSLDFALYGITTTVTNLTANPSMIVMQSKSMTVSFKSFFEVLWEASRQRVQK